VHQKNEKIAMENQHTDGSAGGCLGKKVVVVAVAGVRAKLWRWQKHSKRA